MKILQLINTVSHKNQKTIQKLNISETDLLHYRSLNHIHYSQKTDKYNIDSVLTKRTITIGLEKLLSATQKENYLIILLLLFLLFERGRA